MKAHMRDVVFGTIAGVQGWSFGISSLNDAPGEITPTQMNTRAQAVYAAFQTHCFASAGSKILQVDYGTSVQIQGVRSYQYPADAPALRVGQSNGAAVSGSGTPQQPPQIAVVASLRSDYAARTGRGRCYLPLTGVPLGASPRMTAAKTVSIANGFADFISAVNLIPTGIGAWVVSVVGTDTLGDLPVTRVIVDDVFDTQRNRRNKIIAANRGSAAVVVG